MCLAEVHRARDGEVINNYGQSPTTIRSFPGTGTGTEHIHVRTCRCSNQRQIIQEGTLGAAAAAAAAPVIIVSAPGRMLRTRSRSKRLVVGASTIAVHPSGRGRRRRKWNAAR